jgi:acetyl-CoA acyltransferase
MQNVYLVSVYRTPVTKANRGAFAQVRPDDLIAHAIKGTLAKTNIDPKLIEDVIIGCAMPEGEQGLNIGRIAVLMAGLPHTVPGMTVNRYCSSGVQSMAIAADRIAAGYTDVMVAGGVESMSLVPMGGNKIAANPSWFEHKEELAIAFGMGITAEKVAERWQVSRQDQDAFALMSHQRAVDAISKGYFNAEILPFEVTHRSPDLTTGNIHENKKMVSQDEGPRADTSIEALAKLKPVFASAEKGTVTAGNSSQMSDGAGAAVLVSERFLKQHNLTPIARFCGSSVAGVPPEIMGIGPIEAIPRVLKQAGLSLNEIDWIELNEAFAAQSLAVIRDLKLDPVKVNPLGGAIALGHPLGGTGAIRVATLLHGLQRVKKRYGLVTMCIGTGMGFAALFENLLI